MQSIASLIPTLARVSRAAYGAVAVIGAAALWGWVLDVPALRDIGADFAPMSPAAALAFVLLAGSFFAARTGRGRTSLVVAAIAAGSAALTLVEALSGAPLGMNLEWIAARGGEVPARLSIAQCVTLLLLAIVAPLERDPKVFGFSSNGIAATAIGAVSFFALLGLSLRVLRFDIAAPLLGL